MHCTTTSEDILFSKLKKPGIYEMRNIALSKFGTAEAFTDEFAAFLRKYDWFLDEYIEEWYKENKGK